LIKRKTKSQTTPLRIARNNKIYTNNEDIADQFNKHFINEGPNLAGKTDKSNENPHNISQNATSYYNLLDILKFDNILKLKVALFAHNIINDPTGIPTIFSGTLPLASDCRIH
ncbi:unnamed protein product, partial [Porites lobata]